MINLQDFFNNLKENDQAFSNEHGIVNVLMIENRSGVRYVTCQTIEEDEDQQTTFDAVSGELRPITFIDKLPHFKHCYSDTTLQSAVQMVANSAFHRGEIIMSVEQAKEHLAETIQNTDFNWITGQRAMEVITAYLEGKDIKEVAIP